MTSLSNHVKNGQVAQVRAGGAAINANDMLIIGGPGLKAYPLKTIDYAVTNAVTTLLSQTAIGSAATFAGWDRTPAVTDAYGSIYVYVVNGIHKYSPLGVADTTFTVSNITVSNAGNPKLIMLSNGNLQISLVDTTAGTISCGIFDPITGKQIGSTITVGTTRAAGALAYYDVIPLSGGGSAFSYLNSSGTQMLFQTYDNSGTAVLAATNIQTFGGTPGLVFNRMAQILGANIVVAMKSGTATPSGSTFVIVSTAAVSVKANTVFDAVTAQTYLELSVMANGSFALAVMNGTNALCSVYNSAGTLQGGQYSTATTANSTISSIFRLLNDGTQFWFIFMSTAVVAQIALIPSTGTGFVTTASIAANNTSIDAAIQGTLMVIFFAGAATSAGKYAVIALPDPEMPITNPVLYLGTTPAVGSGAGTTGSLWPRVIFNGDFTAVFAYDQQNTAGTFFSIIKFAASSIIGVSQTTNAANNTGTPSAPTTISFNPGPGAYSVNKLAGTGGTQYDHTSAVPVGCKGTLYNFGATMQGINLTRRNIN